MRKVLLVVLCLIVVGVVAAVVVFRPGRAARVAAGLVSHTLCSETFVAGLDQATTFSETFQTMPGIRYLVPYLHYHVDRSAKTVTVSMRGRFESRAVARDGVGCRLVYASMPNVPIAVASAAGDAGPSSKAPEIADATVVEPVDEKLRGALDRAFAEPDVGPRRATKAVIVLHNGRIVAERYAPGYGIDTPMFGWSMTKSVTNALVGILVRQGKLAAGAPAPVSTWRNPSDPRHAITIDSFQQGRISLQNRPATRGTEIARARVPDLVASTTKTTPLLAQVALDDGRPILPVLDRLGEAVELVIQTFEEAP